MAKIIIEISANGRSKSNCNSEEEELSIMIDCAFGKRREKINLTNFQKVKTGFVNIHDSTTVLALIIENLDTFDEKFEMISSLEFSKAIDLLVYASSES